MPNSEFVITPEKIDRVVSSYNNNNLGISITRDNVEQMLDENKKNDKRLPVYEGTTEPLSSIFGIFTISDKNHFYVNALESERNHENWESILEDFLALT